MNRVRVWVEETHGTFLELIRHFLTDLFQNDLTASRDHLEVFVGTVLGGVTMIGIFLPASLIRKYVDLYYLQNPDLFARAALADKLFFVSLAMAAIGFLTALSWHSLFPDLRDFHILGPLPVTLLRIFAAKFTALFLFASVFILALNGFGILIFPSALETSWQTHKPGPLDMAAHATAVLGASYWFFFTLIAFHGLLLAVLPPRWFARAGQLAQSVLLLVMLAAIPPVFSISNLHPWMNERPQAALWWPPVWFLGLYERMLGNREAYVGELAFRALVAVGASVAATLLFYSLAYRRHAARSLESSKSPGPSRWSTGAGAVFSRLIRRPREQAAFSFSWHTLTRSRQHKVFLTAYAGLGCALVIDGFLTLLTNRRFHGFGRPSLFLTQATLSVPLVLMFFLVSGLRFVFSIPVELRANWLFRFSEDHQRRELLDATPKLLLLLGVIPVVLLSFPFVALMLGTEAAFSHTAIATLLGLLLVEGALWDYRKVPFACSYLAGKRNPVMMLALYWFAFTFFAYAMAAVESWSLRSGYRLAGIAMLLLIALVNLWLTRREHWGKEPLRFEETPDAAVEVLNLES